MYLKDDKLVINVGDITIRSSRVPGGTSQFLLDDVALVGWTDGVDIKRNTTPRQMRSGDFQEVGHHSARYISITGIAEAASNDDLKRMRDDFTSAVVPKTYEPLTVQDRQGTRTSTVTLGGKTSWIQQTDKYATFKLDLYAPDPNIYGPTKTLTLFGSAGSGGSPGGGLDLPLQYPMDYGIAVPLQPLYVGNAGNVDSWPVFRVVGDYPGGFSITDNAGNVITYTGQVTMNAPVIIDSSAGYATQSGSDRSTFLSQRGWFAIPPQQVIQASFHPSQQVNGWCDIIFRDTWI